MSGLLTPDARLRVFGDTGVVLPGAKLYTYVAGSLTTPLATYSDSALSVANLNPVVASAGGLFGPIYLTPGSAYQFLLKDSSGVTVPGWPQDNVMVPTAGVSAPVLVTQGGTGIIVGVSGGVLYFPSTTTMASSAALTVHGVVVGGGVGAAPGSTAAGTAGQVLTSNGAALDPTFQASGAGVITLLKANSGTDTSAGATNVDTIAITGLTAKDALLVVYEIEAAAQITAIPRVYSSTDSLDLVTLTAGNNLPAGQMSSGEVWLRQRQSGATALRAKNTALRGAGSTASPSTDNEVANVTLTTNWTGSWTLALRHAGVTAGGTFSWVWTVLKVAGQ